MAKEIFKEKADQYLGLLKQYTPILTRVHGSNHPELSKVNELVKTLVGKMENKETDLTPEFSMLREVTGNYEVPGDGCETYEAVYRMLGELDEAHKN